MYFDYDFTLQRLYSSNFFKGFTELNFFFNKVVFNQTTFITHKDDKAKILRGNSTLLFQDIRNIRNIKFGDVITKSNIWNPSLRIGGVSIATDFSMKPDLITYPLPEFTGETALPSTIDIYSENAKIYTKDLKPGIFEIKDIPITTPEGNVRIIIRDILGRERIVEFPFATHSKLLKKGLSSYSFSAGFLRQNFLTENFNYANFVTIGSYQYGLTNKITLGFNGFLEKFKKGNIGISPIFLIPKVGLLTPSFALSYDGKNFGNFYSLGYEKNFQYFRLMFQYEKSSQNFFKPSTVLGSLKESFLAFSNFNVPFIGSFSLSFFDRKYFGNRKTKNLNISLTKNIYRSLNLTAAYNKAYNDEYNYDGYRFSLNMPLGYNHYSSLTGSFDSKNQENYSFLFRNSNLNSLGVGYSFRATKSNGRNNLLGKISYNSHYTSTYLDFSYSKNKNTEEHGYRLGLYGSIIYIDNEIFFKRYVGSGFALVKIDPPVEGVKVLFNNRPIGTTDKSGTLFIGKIAPYIKNEIKIDPTSLNIRTHVDKTIKTLVPLKKHGYLIRFKSKKVNSVRLKIIFPDGTYPAPGLKFDVDNNINVGIIGFNGKAFIENITAGKHIVTVDYGYGLCSFELNIKEEWLNKIVPYIGEYTCVPQTDTMIAKKEKNIIVKPAKLVQNKKEEEKLKKFKKVSYKKPNPKDLNKIDKNINNNAKVNSNTYTIEVGKFDSKEIEKAVEEYEEFQKEVVKEGDIYKIYIGKFKTKEDAERFMKIFRLKGKIITVRD